jgi:hypothetical protein
MLQAYDWVLQEWHKFIGFSVIEKPRTMYDEPGKRDADSQVMPSRREVYHLTTITSILFANTGPMLRGLLRLAGMSVGCRVINTEMVNTTYIPGNHHLAKHVTPASSQTLLKFLH